VRNALSRNVEESPLKVLDPDAGADNLQSSKTYLVLPRIDAYLCVKFDEDFSRIVTCRMRTHTHTHK